MKASRYSEKSTEGAVVPLAAMQRLNATHVSCCAAKVVVAASSRCPDGPIACTTRAYEDLDGADSLDDDDTALRTVKLACSATSITAVVNTPRVVCRRIKVAAAAEARKIPDQRPAGRPAAGSSTEGSTFEATSLTRVPW